MLSEVVMADLRFTDCIMKVLLKLFQIVVAYKLGGSKGDDVRFARHSGYVRNVQDVELIQSLLEYTDG